MLSKSSTMDFGSPRNFFNKFLNDCPRYLTDKKITIKNKVKSLNAKEENPKISVIVPVYNVEIYLKECLDSLSNQTFKDIEIICINDGSSDNSLDILNECREEDNRIREYG